ncbi:alcohol dehydrogenase catalytic domain-containing protein [Williamsia sp.]|uniref:alcohol dehydrogenase catalytic domain-containing protein n=1 Tax=Williamsia sp. TaxID=1872085 RepID=UPI001A1CDB0B|nr:alcohol dehydrogenase catalytic domain-containing protein [Williamsia sp.]MBJ7287291.1 alcohol dehydrogenase catalytic domain-containing protein [Williamsia sp.]
MRAVVYETFGAAMSVRDIPEPTCPAHGVVVAVAATGLCRSDWHGWQGHDPDIPLPNVPGHELAGTVVEVGADVRGWAIGARVTVPFVCACGDCGPCRRGDQQVCERQTQPGFTHQGSFAERVALDHADVNLVALPDDVDFDTAAGLGCRFATAYRAVTQVADVQAGESVAVHGCGGVGLSAVMIAAARGATVIAIDPSPVSRDLAMSLGATRSAASANDLHDMDVSIDAFGAPATMRASIACLRPRGRHVQVGLLGDDVAPAVPMGLVIAHELQLLGSHGMAAHTYPVMLAEIAAGTLRPQALLRDAIGLDDAPARLMALGDPGAGVGGVTVVHP